MQNPEFFRRQLGSCVLQNADVDDTGSENGNIYTVLRQAESLIENN